MISFIVIGKNEDWKLTKCLQSLFDTIKYNQMIAYEIIYVDSNSGDNSIERAKDFGNVKIYKITSRCNAADCRNVGAKESKGDVLCFVDGDMEIMPAFFKDIYSHKSGIIHPFISGKIINYYYNREWKLITKDPLVPDPNDSVQNVTGGFFLIKREYWFSVKGMRNIFMNGQDLDLGLRIKSELGISHFKKKQVAAIHHTISYLDNNRMWGDLLKGIPLYYRSLLYRKHILSPLVYTRILRSEYSLIILILLIIAIFIKLNLFLLSIYFIIILIKSIKMWSKNSNSIISLYFYYIIRDLIVLFGLIFFHPRERQKVNYSPIS